MKKLYYIKDVRVSEYYWTYRIDEGFAKDIKEATPFDNKEDVLKTLQEEYTKDSFSGRWIEIVEAYYTD